MQAEPQVSSRSAAAAAVRTADDEALRRQLSQLRQEEGINFKWRREIDKWIADAAGQLVCETCAGPTPWTRRTPPIWPAALASGIGLRQAGLAAPDDVSKLNPSQARSVPRGRNRR